MPFPLARERLRDVTSRDVSDWFGDLERKGVGAPLDPQGQGGAVVMLARPRRTATFPAPPPSGSATCRPRRAEAASAEPLTVEDVGASSTVAPSGGCSSSCSPVRVRVGERSD